MHSKIRSENILLNEQKYIDRNLFQKLQIRSKSSKPALNVALSPLKQL